jgi:hypothetical protein
MTNQLTAEEYTIINEQRSNLENLFHKPPLTIRNPPIQWLKQMQKIHRRIFGGNVCLSCSGSKLDAVRRLYHKLKEYESTHTN